MKYFLILFFIVSFSELIAAELNDKVFLSEGESVSCKLLLKNDAANAMSIEYKDENNIKQKKSAGEIWGYQTSSGDVYQSKSVKIDGKEQSYFAHMITKGQAALFTVHTKESGEHRFIEKIGEEPVRLKPGLEINILAYLFQECPVMSQSYIEDNEPKKLRSLANLVVEYGNCVNAELSTSIITEFNNSKTKYLPGVFLGPQFSTLQSKDNYNNIERGTNLLFGANVEVVFSRSFSVVPSMEYSNFQITNEGPYPAYPHLTLTTKCTISRIRADLALRYYLGHRLIRPYIAFSPSFTIAGDVSVNRQVVGTEGQILISKPREFYTVGAIGTLGAKYIGGKISPFLEFRYAYERVQPKAGQTAVEDYHLNSAQIVFGVAF